MRKFEFRGCHRLRSILIFNLSAVGGSLFTFGSVLLWAWMKGMLPHSNGVLTLAGLTSGFLLARLSAEYLESLDSQVD